MNAKQREQQRKSAVSQIAAILDSLDEHDCTRNDVMDDIKELFCEHCWKKITTDDKHEWCGWEGTPME